MHWYVFIILATNINNSYINNLKTNNQKLKLIIFLNSIIFIIGTIANSFFAVIALCYIATMFLIYYFGSKIKDYAINVGYIWISKWTAFMIFLVISGLYLFDSFLYLLSMFFVFNLSVNPADFFVEKGLDKNGIWINHRILYQPSPHKSNVRKNIWGLDLWSIQSRSNGILGISCGFFVLVNRPWSIICFLL